MTAESLVLQEIQRDGIKREDTRKNSAYKTGGQEAVSSSLATRTTKKSCNRKGCRAFSFCPVPVFLLDFLPLFYHHLNRLPDSLSAMPCFRAMSICP